eukprot:gnl/TRDRNA2_/TRDRNA2_176864_c4_seq17.p1 gnl/TRDRNA2_/TRDRNA2_176864_c4~~gnl/TRDRNA2_/TRDRNA2_176864_c4_seq17.p1  ORF type:complete len:386 (-),score=62.66 gnl/TRDRNA2_/TRDRNA2_176864_c4_seq17:160-1317(-)
MESSRPIVPWRLELLALVLLHSFALALDQHDHCGASQACPAASANVMKQQSKEEIPEESLHMLQTRMQIIKGSALEEEGEQGEKGGDTGHKEGGDEGKEGEKKSNTAKTCASMGSTRRYSMQRGDFCAGRNRKESLRLSGAFSHPQCMLRCCRRYSQPYMKKAKAMYGHVCCIWEKRRNSCTLNFWQFKGVRAKNPMSNPRIWTHPMGGEATDPTKWTKGIRCEFFGGKFGKVPDMQEKTPAFVRVEETLNFQKSKFPWKRLGKSMEKIWSWFSARCMGAIKVKKSGYYKIKLSSDDGSKLYLNKKKLIDNDGLHDMRSKTSGETHLKAVKYVPIRVEWFDKIGPAGLVVKYKHRSNNKAEWGNFNVLPEDELWHDKDAGETFYT